MPCFNAGHCLNFYKMIKKTFFILTAIILSGINVFAQGCEDPSGDDSEVVKVFGFIQPQYEYHFTSVPENTFKFKRARIGVTGNIPYDFSYYIVMENSAFVSGTGNPYLLDAFITYKRFEWAKISMGSFKMPFGQEVNTACSGLHTIERSFISDYFVAPQRDMGLMILGGSKESLINYAIALTNGKGLGIKDNNVKKDFSGRLTVQPLEFLRFGGSFRYGFPNPEILGETKDRLSYAAEIQLNYGNLVAQAEYMYDEGDYVRGGAGCGATEVIEFGDKRNGLYGMILYMTPWNLQPVIKYEMMNTDLTDESANIQYNVITAGINYFFNPNTRLQFNYRYRAENGAEKKNDEILMQMQIKF